MPSSRAAIDAVAHQIAIALLADVTDMNPDAEFDSAVLRYAGIALDESVLHLDRAADRVDNAAELDDRAVAGALDRPTVTRGDGGIDQIASETAKAREGSVLVGAGNPAVPDDVGPRSSRPSWSSHICPNASSGPPVLDAKDSAVQSAASTWTASSAPPRLRIRSRHLQNVWEHWVVFPQERKLGLISELCRFWRRRPGSICAESGVSERARAIARRAADILGGYGLSMLRTIAIAMR